MPPVPLPVPTPNLPFSNIGNVVPNPPNDPPSVADVIAAKKYAERARTAAQYPNHIDDQTTAGALVYENAILAAASAGAAAPPWFAAALDLGLRPIKTRLDAIEGRLDGIDTRLDSIVTKIDQLTIFASQNSSGQYRHQDRPIDDFCISSEHLYHLTHPSPISTLQNHNRTLGDGQPEPFKPVPFPDGRLPSENDNTPTALTNLAVLSNLSYEEPRAYCEGYYPGRAYGHGQRLGERRMSIREAIGCTAG
ncbi:hypothetical protein K438DRAFT_580627 [Mycena galopus ATCC 62051]|nr:hypothetical protein K438DRAFT_580627 [Mycena galopus ATCC 62051]